MALKPTKQVRGIARPRKVSCEHEQGRLRKQREKAAYYKRNPHLKWGEHG